MASVWYIGNAAERRITAAEWAAVGVSDAVDSVFNAANGWSIPNSAFTSQQLNVLATYFSDFLMNQADGPRTYGNLPGAPTTVTAPKTFSKEIAAIGDIFSINVEKYANLTMHVKGVIASTSINVAFEASLDSTDGTNGTWFPVQASNTASNTASSSSGNQSLASDVGAANGWKVNVASYLWFRIRCTARTAGSVLWTIAPSAFGVEPVPAVQSHAVTITPSGTAYTTTTTAGVLAVSARNAACYLFQIALSNLTDTLMYVKLYNKSSAPVAADVPLVTIPVPAGGVVIQDFGQIGMRFTAGLAIGATALLPATDVTAVKAGSVIALTYV